jgi:type VI secretion system secreted protein Hcp
VGYRRIGTDDKAQQQRPAQPSRRGGGSVLALQRVAGNRAVAGLMRQAADTEPTAHAHGSGHVSCLVTMKGAKQGDIKGDGRDGKIEGLSLHLGVKSPRDVATGQASGKRQHAQLTITKPYDRASPLLFTAATTNEVLPTVTIERMHHGSVTEVITLTNASIAAFDQSTEDDDDVETLGLTYGTITISNPKAQTTASDEWSSQGR